MARRHSSPRRHTFSKDLPINPLFVRELTEGVPRARLRSDGLGPDLAYQVIHDEIAMDGNARLNLATFVTTWMEPQADRLYAEAVDKNMIDKDEYPQTAAIEGRCVRMLADLWHAPDPDTTIGVSTTGSSEACMLAGLALKRRWQIARRATGAPTDRPNIVVSSAVQVVWEKFANYFEVEPRYVPVTPEHPTLDADGVLAAVDERTIGVVPILGVTYTGVYEPVAEIARALDELYERTGLDIPIHVDGASGGFVAPFLEPQLDWDFRLPRVVSINASGHKFGLVYPGLGWVVWRQATDVPEELIFRVAYLGGDMPTLALNFSRPGAQVLLQYYTFLRLGREGFTAVHASAQRVARMIADELASLGPFEVIGDGRDIPVVAWRLRPGEVRPWDLNHLSHELRAYGWQVPAYPMPDAMSDVTVMRAVVRSEFSADMATLFLDDLAECVEVLERHGTPPPVHPTVRESFHH